MTTDIASSLKTCFKCGKSLPRTEFYRHPMMADGLLGKCKTCTKADASAHRLANLEKLREYDKTRAKLPHRVKLGLKLQAERRKKDRRKDRCRSKVARAVRAGILVWQPCCICGNERSMAHHESYDRPLDVVWYCQVHHSARHQEMKKQGIDP